jgi:RNA polymerase sigma-70 factor (ECF subfamily)
MNGDGMNSDGMNRGEGFDFEGDLIALLPQLRAFARSLVGTDGDDLVQDSLVRALKARHTFVPGTNLKAWMFTILRNQWVTSGRRKRVETGLAEEHAPPTPPTQEHAVALRDFARLLKRLPVKQREALLLVAAEGFSYEEAAAISRTSVGTVKSRVSRARAFLAPMFLAATPLGCKPISDRPGRHAPRAARTAVADAAPVVLGAAASPSARRSAETPT